MYISKKYSLRFNNECTVYDSTRASTLASRIHDVVSDVVNDNDNVSSRSKCSRSASCSSNPGGRITVIGSSDSNGSDKPISFSAITRILYERFSWKSFICNRCTVASTLPTCIHIVRRASFAAIT
ncbi:hypothetical protein DERF_012712 [Dermatophagoides farinae]|uniref:Uncharacterized protein n=1 Tax=Dermatophagoides farinae TaxID=6954 RepID=A0A922L3Q0_DERFA|nr:hypothetical protein DERF_012712 [Dermatophagoides farinae]